MANMLISSTTSAMSEPKVRNTRVKSRSCKATQLLLLARRLHAKFTGQCQQEQDAVNFTPVLSLCAPHSYAWKSSALSEEAPGQ